MASKEDRDALQNLETIRSFLRGREFNEADYQNALKASKALRPFGEQRASGKAMLDIVREGLEGIDRKIQEAREHQQQGIGDEPEEE